MCTVLYCTEVRRKANVGSFAPLQACYKPVAGTLASSVHRVTERATSLTHHMQAHAAEAAEAPVVGVEIDCTVVAGRGLVAKDRSLLGKKSSDPYVVISCGKRRLGTTKVVPSS